MRLLLDTHVWLWLQTTPERLGPQLALAQDPGNELLLSVVSGWEIAIKWELGRLPLPEDPRHYVADRIATSATAILPVTMSHALAVAELPGHHRDPFDRLLISQAIIENLTVLTADAAWAPYGIDLIRVT
ncbi:MAG: type II toxin-antitoxin system VapC family toxin [Actinomycetota bacterium]